MTAELWQELKGRQERVEAALGTALQRMCAEVPEPLAEAMAYSLLAPGKRLRPLLTILASEACGGTIEQALPAACAVEMVHTYSLVHDDLPAMDDDDLRRGLPTCHKKFGEALAILAGDALLTMAFEVIAGSYEPKTAAVSCLELARGAGAAGMVGGQVLDLAAEGRIPFSRDPESAEGSAITALEGIHRRKTGALFRSSLRLGVYAAQTEAGVNKEDLAAADDYATAFGLAFQIQDDLIDVEGNAEQTGKRVGKDAARGKLTYPGVLGMLQSHLRKEELCVEAMKAGVQLRSDLLIELAKFAAHRDR